MVEITKEGKFVHVEVKGLHKLWAFKDSITIPRNNIVNVYHDVQEVSAIRGIRAPGISIPYLIIAGTILTDEGPVFCDVVNRRNAISIQLRNDYYAKLIVEVRDPSETIYFLARH